MANMRFDMMRYINVHIIKNPRRDSMGGMERVEK
jgi:hypothetical protein